jgi:pimeloyl-ACP methyl ester carboxylesterase
MSQLIRIAGPDGEPRASVVLVHGLGGHVQDTWRQGGAAKKLTDDSTFWPPWLARDCERLAVYLVGYDAPVSRVRGTAMHLTDQARNILARILAEPALARGPLILIGHSLGGLVIKQLLRTAESMAQYDAGAADLIHRVEKVAFLATPHSGAGLASLGDRLRILVRPSAATASLVRNDPNLRDLNNWYRDWANGHGVAHLILTESAPARILGMIVPPDSADPGLANVRSVAIAADHIAICKPADNTTDIYVFVRDFINRATERPKQALESKVDALPGVTAQAVVTELQRLGVVAKAADAGLGEATVLTLARRLKPNEQLTLEQAVVEVSAAVDIAIDVVKKGARGTNLDELVDAVLKTIAEKTRAGDFEGAAAEAERGFAEWKRAETERRETSLRSGIALLEAGLEQDILRRDAPAAARRVEDIIALEHPNDPAARFAALCERMEMFYVRGRDQGV